MSLAITPDTKIGALLEAYPQIEEVLVSMAPAFRKLRNPVVKRTVAKVATLEQAAQIGGVSLREMIRTIREATGAEAAPLPPCRTSQESLPDSRWLLESRVIEEIDADRLLETGVHPVGKIRAAVAALRPGESVLLRSSFRPQPLIDTLLRAGAAVHASDPSPGYVTYFGRERAAG